MNIGNPCWSSSAWPPITRGRLSLQGIEDHKEQICRLSCCAWLVWVFSMVQRVPTAGLCPKILFCIVARSLACLCRALGCCIRRLTTLAISAFICPCPKPLYAWDSFWHFPLTTLCTACTQDHWSCNPHWAPPQKAIQPYKEAWGTCKEPWGFAGSLGCLQRRSYAPTNLMHFFHVPISRHAVTCSVRSPQKPCQRRAKRPMARKVTCFIFCCLSTWIVKMATTLWERFSSLIFPDSSLCNDLELLEKGTPSQMQWYSVPFQHQDI